MPIVDALVSCPLHDSFRVRQVAGIFDVTLPEHCEERFQVEVPGSKEDWQIGVIVGPSGSGKSTVARQAFGDQLHVAGEWPSDKAIVDGFGDLPIRDIVGALTAVGFSSPPSWIKPYSVLSNGEKFRCDLAGQSAWVISFLESASAAQNLQGMTARQQYYDALMFRAWLRPERVGLESKYGSRADAEEHSESSLTDSELIHADLCEQLNRGVVDDLLAFNYGPQAVGSVYVVPTPLQQAKRAVLTELLTKLWSDPALLSQFVAQTDMDAVFDVMEVPRVVGGRQ